MEKDIFTIKESTLSYGRGYVYSLQYHLVWCTKYRKQVLKNGLDTECKKMLYELRYVPKMKFGGSRYECFSQITENAMMIVNELELESVKTNWKT